MYPVVSSAPRQAGEIAAHVGGRLTGNDKLLVTGVCALNQPRAQALTFATSAARLEGREADFREAVVLVPDEAEVCGIGAAIAVRNPRLAFARAAALFQQAPAPAISASATIAPTARIAEDVTIGPNVVIADHVSIGRGTVIRAGAVIGPGVTIGERCLIKSNAVIGEEGFGMETDDDGQVVRIPHFGSVVLADEVEIGCLTSIARGTIGNTTVGERTKIDDHVFIAHNCTIGSDVMIIACAEISGSVRLGNSVWIGPNASVINGVGICDRTMVGIGACVVKTIDVPGVYAGVPAKLFREI